MRAGVNIRSEDGQTMVEFAIVLPVLFLLLFGVIQFGIIFNNYITLTDAVRAGARKAAVARNLGASGAVAAAQAAVRASASDLDKMKLPDPTVTSTWEHADPVTVCAIYPYKIDLGVFVAAQGNLSSCTKERVE
ncbi:MAG: pilus assembly protein TadE [Actinomycetia bacterium]|jgi:Flp pilus assembly protein TadG|nr:pilus assembly protein TadE [Actinomycetes bacterium]